MSEKQLLLSFPEARTVNYIKDMVDVEGKPVIDVNTKMPVKTLDRSEVVSCIIGLDMSMLNATALAQAGFDFFDIQELRAKIRKSMDARGRHEHDDRYLILSEAQHKILIDAVKKFDWTLKQKLEDGTETTGVDFWLNWFEFFQGIKQPKEHNVESPDSSYATWALAKAARLSKEAAEEKLALEKAANEKAADESKEGGENV